MADDIVPYDDLLSDLRVTVAQNDETLISAGIQRMLLEIDPSYGNDYTNYRDDPVAFVRKELGIKAVTEDQIRVLTSLRDYTVTIVQSATGVGKTFIGAAAAIWAYKVFDRVQVYTAAAPPRENLERLMWGEIYSLIEKNKVMFEDDSMKSLMIYRSAKDKIEGVTIPTTGTPEDRETKFSGKHHPVLIFIIDEGDAVPDEVYKGIEGCMSGGEIVRLLIFYNPKKKVGSVYRRVRDGAASIVPMSALNHINVISGENRIKGAVTRDVTVKRINEWSTPIPAHEDVEAADCFEVPDFLIGCVTVADNGDEYPPLPAGIRKITNQEMYYKVLGIYPSSGVNQLINEEDIEAAIARWHHYVSINGQAPPTGMTAIQGIDVAEFGTDSNVCCWRYGNFVPEMIKWGGVDTDMTAQRAANEYKKKLRAVCVSTNCGWSHEGDDAMEMAQKHKHTGHVTRMKHPKSNIDAIGVGSAVPYRMTRLGCKNASPVKVSTRAGKSAPNGEFKLLRDQIMWDVREWMQNGAAMIPPDSRLTEAMRVITYEEVGDYVVCMSKKEMRKILGYSPDEFDALALTFAPSNMDFGVV